MRQQMMGGQGEQPQGFGGENAGGNNGFGGGF
jgi:hypothetical protein